MARKTIVVCHGYSLAERLSLCRVVDAAGQPKDMLFGDWDHVCIGEGRGQAGRIRTTVEVAQERRADCIIWTTGASFSADGVSEAQYMQSVAEGLLRPADDLSIQKLRAISLCEDVSTKTHETMVAIGSMLDGLYGSEPLAIVHVSSANHISRVLRDALVRAARPHWRHEAVAAATSYGGKGPAEVVVYDLGEPVHKSVRSHGV